MPRTTQKRKPARKPGPASSPSQPRPLRIQACILAGGLSTRMQGRDKSRLKIRLRPDARAKTFTAHIRATVRELGMNIPVNVIRRDTVPRCGPLGGILTALEKPFHTRAHACADTDVILFLACDMPFVPARHLRKLISMLRKKDTAVFTLHGNLAGFPMLLRRSALPIIKSKIEKGEFKLQKLQTLLQARLCPPANNAAGLLRNINTPEELHAARQNQTPSHVS